MLKKLCHLVVKGEICFKMLPPPTDKHRSDYYHDHRSVTRSIVCILTIECWEFWYKVNYSSLLATKQPFTPIKGDLFSIQMTKTSACLHVTFEQNIRE